MHVLITGHQGYIGPIAIRTFLNAGHDVSALDTGYFAENVDTTSTVQKAHREIDVDIRKVEPKHLEGIDAIVHLAAISNDPMGDLAPSLTHDINFEATMRLARIAREAGVSRFILASSCSIYGAADVSKPLDETAPMNPQSAYAETKVKSEKALAELADGRFSPVFLRNATAFGVSPRIRFDLVLNNLVAVAKTTGAIRVLSDGTPWRPLVHIEDIAHAALCAVQAPREAIHAEAFNIGRSDMNYQVSQLADAVARHVPGSRVEILNQTGPDPRSYRVDFSKALSSLPGFQPKWDLDSGCRELADWFDARAIESDNVGSRQFVRLKQLRHLMDSSQLDDELQWR